MNGEFTAKAKTLWDAIPQDVQKKLLGNVWCMNCLGETTIIDFRGQIEDGDLVLSGSCAKCGGEVVRGIESE